MAGNNRIGSRSIAPQTRRTVGQENIPPQQTQHSGRQPRARQEAFRDLASAGRAPLQARNLNIGVPQSQARQAPAKPHSMRTSGHGVSIGQAVHNHLEAITRQIEILAKHGGKSAWERPLQVAELVKARLPQLPAAKSIALLKELQSILGNPNTRERHSALASFVAHNRLVQGAAVARPAPAPYAAKPAPMPHAARPVPAPARGMGRPVAAPQRQPAKRVFKSFEELATARPFPPAARPSPAPQPSRLNHSFDARGEVASLRNRPAATTAPARTASAPPQYGRSSSAGARPAAQPQPQFELKHFIGFVRDAAQQDSGLRYSEAEIYSRAAVEHNSYLARLNGKGDGAAQPQSRPARTQSAPPRLPADPAPHLDFLQRNGLDRETDARNAYRGETGGYHLAYEDHLARQQPVTYGTATRPQRTQPRPKLTEDQIESIRQFENQRAEQANEYPDHDEAIRRYKMQNGYS
ncbi:type III effector protein [Ralstonia solanacearum]|uniref:Type III effector protein n=1 Tax=Ralstonia solanacearum TaxID=305 RepID=A0AAD0WI83_RALSL|nr:type III effector protein [Ralstonia solanacearum]AXV83913.1 type III effector protein [Ralstonia solanacearum]AXW55045.1 type III effector protein [Ralstonia solanacearum]